MLGQQQRTIAHQRNDGGYLCFLGKKIGFGKRHPGTIFKLQQSFLPGFADEFVLM